MHWTVSTVGSGIYTSLAFLNNKMNGLAFTLQNDHVTIDHYKTTDGGNTWTYYNPAGPVYFLMAAIPGTNYFVTADCGGANAIGSSYFANGGSDFTAIDTAGRGTTDGYYMLTFHDIYTGYASGFTVNPSIGGISRWNPGVLGIGGPDANISSGLTVYPNPVMDKLYVKGIPSQSMIRIYDSNGRMVFNQTESNNMVFIDMSSFSPGFYFLKSENGSAKIVKK